MIRSLKILKEASVDIKEITTWYKNISPLLAIRLVSQLYDGFDKIITSPDAWFNLTKKVKRYRLQGFPYLILFFKEADNIVVFAVIHEKRNPKIWKSRIRRK
ncbi:MAG: type II toxin-antitoxin system RelE/ParE family toxin, partial [Chitinophagaceae bacterium]|nr:type II toxin-antitoxin system RelE/ParE family toxin [Chitinophagaceae bacterium]